MGGFHKLVLRKKKNLIKVKPQGRSIRGLQGGHLRVCIVVTYAAGSDNHEWFNVAIGQCNS